MRDVDTSYDRYQIAKKQCRTDTAAGLEEERGYYDEGRTFTIDRYLRSMGRNAAALQPKLRLSTYNTTLAALAEANGTLLSDRFILVLDEPLRQPKNWIAERGK